MITGFVLAGGKSSRMGQDKACLTIGSQSLIEMVIQRLRPHVDRLIIVGHAMNADRFRELEVDEVVIDLKPAYGPLMGVYTGLMSTETSVNLFVSCDMPWVEGKLLQQLVACCSEDNPVAASRHPFEGLQPLPLVCHVNICRTLGSLLDHGERSLQALLRQPQAQLVTIKEPALWHCFTNVNTPADYAKLQDASTLPRRS